MTWASVSGFFRGLNLKLSLLTILLLLGITAGISLVVMEMMDRALVREMVKRGASISASAASPAGYSLLVDDRLALDNLAANVGRSQDDLLYLAIVDSGGTIRGHNRLEVTGQPFPPTQGKTVLAQTGLEIRKIDIDGQEGFEFRTPIEFAGKTVGMIHLGLDARSLREAKAATRSKILLIAAAALALGIAGSFLISSHVTRPVSHLADGVLRLKEGNYLPEIRVTSRDELGQLTREFNDMARVIAHQNASLSSYARSLEESYVSTVKILAAAIDARDEYTLGHSTRVANLAGLIGRRLGLAEAELADLTMACFLHDLGKIRIPDRILNKRGPLNNREYQAVLHHPEHGAEILRLSDSLHKFIPTVLHHHEWYNGNGYPSGLMGEDIPLTAGIVAIADAYDAMVSSRPYRQGLSRAEAVEEIRKCRGTQFAPYLVDIFVEALEDYQEGQELLLPFSGVA